MRTAGDLTTTRRRLVEFAAQRPIVASGVVAAVVRVIVAATSFVVHHNGLLDDERSYLALARFLSHGGTPSQWYAGFKDSPFPAISAFVVPLSWLERMFGPSRLSGQLLAATFGVLTVLLVTWLAVRIVEPVWALAAGLVAALLPTQVLWSSLVLRESMIWASLALLALAIATASPTRWRAPVVAAAIALMAVARLRPQTAVVTACALLGTVVLAWRALPRGAALGFVAVAVLAPVTGGLGLVGVRFVLEERGSAGAARSALAAEADSSFVDLEPVDPKSVTVPSTVVSHRPTDAPERRVPFDVVTDDGRTIAVIRDERGRLVRVDGAPGLRGVVDGVVGVVVRPLPWESTADAGPGVLAVESVSWYTLVALAVVGAIAGRHRREVVAFPILVVVGLLTLAVLTEGNVGTALRHRAQTQWALVVLAAVGAQSVWHRYAARRARLVP